MTFIKSIEGNQSTQIYFDEFNNKHVKRGGTLAWRCNNPGLIRSHSDIAIRIGSIGHCGQYPVFPNIFLGRQALYAWLRLESYYLEPLIAIANYHSPEEPEKYLTQLCLLTGLNRKSIPSQLTQAEFDQLAWAIEEVGGGHRVLNNENFELIPKILGKFKENKGLIEHYLIADQRILSKEATIAEIRAEKIDAVIVHCRNGKEYIRSRPGHILSEITVEAIDQADLPKIENIIRDGGTYREGQAIWGFINGIINPPYMAKKNLELMIQAVNGEQVWAFINNTGVDKALGFPDALKMECGYSPKIVDTGIDYINFLSDLSENLPEKPPIIIVAHSEGAMIAEFATKKLPVSIRKKIQFWTLGGAGFVPEGSCHQGTCNYINHNDQIVKAASPIDYRILITRDKLKEKNLDYVANFLAEEDVLVQGLDMGTEYKLAKENKAIRYKKRLDELSNTTVLYNTDKKGIHHGFSDPHYQQKLKELINGRYGKK
jgi:hypothetical protein